MTCNPCFLSRQDLPGRELLDLQGRLKWLVQIFEELDDIHAVPYAPVQAQDMAPDGLVPAEWLHSGDRMD